MTKLTQISLFLMHEPQSFPFPLLKQDWKAHQKDVFIHFKKLNQEMKWKSNLC